MSNQAFNKFLLEHLPYLEKHFQVEAEHTTSYLNPQHKTSFDPSDKMVEKYLARPVRYFCSVPGKRIRPALALLGAYAAGATSIEEAACALPAASAIELFQSAALIHDDIADESLLRRGTPCLYRTEGVGLAINVGDALIIDVYAALLKADLEEGTRSYLMRELTDMMRHTLVGQALDLGWARDAHFDLEQDDALAMCASKTAYYTAAYPLKLGVLSFDPGAHELADTLFNFGLLCGVAFQLQDDLLNLDGAASGKDELTDITEGKKTYTLAYALSHLDRPYRQELLEIVSAKTEDRERLLRARVLMRVSGAIEATRERSQELIGHANELVNGLETLGVPRAYVDVLQDCAEFFVKRLA